jgi:hypothetical protein
MPMCYTSSLATPGASTTSGTTNTETDAIYLKPASAVPARNVMLQAAYVVGAGNALTAISGLRFRIVRATTASTSGTATTPNPKDAGMQAATAIGSTGGTVSTTGRTNHVIFGCGAAGPGGWVAPNPDSMIVVTSAATQPSVDLLAVATNVSLTYEFSIEHQE